MHRPVGHRSEIFHRSGLPGRPGLLGSRRSWNAKSSSKSSLGPGLWEKKKDVGRLCWGRCWPLQNGGRRPGDWGDWAGRLPLGGALCMTPLEGFCFYFDLVLVFFFCDFQSFSKDGHIQQIFQPPKVEPMPCFRIPQWIWQTRLLPPQGFLSNFRSWGLKEIKEWASWSQLDQVVWAA